MLFSNLENGTVQNHPELFNFDGDQDPVDVDIFDVQALFSQLQESTAV